MFCCLNSEIESLKPTSNMLGQHYEVAFSHFPIYMIMSLLTSKRQSTLKNNKLKLKAKYQTKKGFK